MKTERSENSELRIVVLLSLQRAMLGEVFPSLRGVTVDWNHETVHVLCFVDGPLTSLDEESLDAIETQVHADLSLHGRSHLPTCVAISLTRFSH
jgi:hypothetical protein